MRVALRLPARRHRGEPPSEFRTRYFAEFEQAFHDDLSTATGLLQDQQFFFRRMKSAHLQQIRPQLLLRHAIPFLAVGEVYGFSKSSPQVLAACLGAHTLTLTHLDYHLDGAMPRRDNAATASKLSAETAVSYAVRMAFRSASLLAGIECGPRILREVIDPVSGFVLERMHEDWVGRYNVSPLYSCSTAVQDYLTLPGTRLLGSGYWDVMMRAAFIAGRPSSDVPLDLLQFGYHLRRLRQLVDEFHDCDEDLAAGICTLPLLLRAKLDSDYGAHVVRIWRDSPGSDVASPINDEVADSLSELVQSEAASARSFADRIGQGELAFLVDLKLAKFETLVLSRKEPA